MATQKQTLTQPTLDPITATLAPLAAAVAQATLSVHGHKEAVDVENGTVGDRFRAYAAACARLITNLDTDWPEKLSERRGKESIKYPVIGRSKFFDPYAAAFGDQIKDTTLRTVYSQLRSMVSTMKAYPQHWANVEAGIPKEKLRQWVTSPLMEGKPNEVKNTRADMDAAQKIRAEVAKQNRTAPLTMIDNAVAALKANPAYVPAVTVFEVAVAQLVASIKAANLTTQRAAMDTLLTTVAPQQPQQPQAVVVAPPPPPAPQPIEPAPSSATSKLAELARQLKAGGFAASDGEAFAAAAAFLKS